MFGPEYIPAAYLEERLAAEKAKRDAEEKRQQEQAQAAAKAPHTPGQHIPSSLSQIFAQQRPQVPRSGSSTILGSIYQNLAKTAAGTTTPTSRQTSRGHSPTPREMTAEEKRAFDEKWREIDMVPLIPPP